ncbi:MAG: YqgE/AlgH family protein [Chlamydiales bacterium]|nr:YqgE/AlgH family protein [Chlamydiales bacterium]
MASAPYSNIEKGTLLLATPEIDSGIFFRAVVVVCEHNPSGTFGLIINKPLDVELPEEVINVNQLANPRVGLRAGGPVQTNQMMLLHNYEDATQQMLQLCDGVFLGGDLQFLQEVVTDAEGPEVLLCFGYAGWGAGQLEREFLDGSWLLQQAKPDAIFTNDPDHLWQGLLRRMGGRYASLSLIPDDLTLN